RTERGGRDPAAHRGGAEHHPERAGSQGVPREGGAGVTRLATRLTELVGIEHPIVQTGMGWVAGPSLVAGTANAGGLGILASATMTLPELEEAIAKTKAKTDRPFGVNIRADASDAAD